MATGPRDLGRNGAPSPASTATATANPRYDRVPPHDLRAEEAVLGAALLSRAALAEIVEIVNAEDFYRGAHRTIYESITELFARGDSIDPITVANRLKGIGKLDDVGGASALHDLYAGVPTAANAVYYGRIVAEMAVLRRLIDAGTEVVKLGYDGGEDVNLIVDRAESIVFQAAMRREGRDVALLKTLLNESFARIEQRHLQQSEVTGLATGFDDLDRKTAGLQPQDLIIIAARPSMGKSALALGIARYVTVKLNRPVVLFSLEMSKSELADRLLSSEAGVDSSKIRTGRNLQDGDWVALADALGVLDNAPLFIDESSNLTLMEIRSKCRRLQQKHGLDLVIVDYLQLMESHHRVDNRQVEVSEFSRGLKMLAKELDVPVIALSQLSRQTEGRTDKRPQLSDLRDSGAIEQDADIVAFIYREEVYDPDTERKGEAELIIAKHRNGPTGKVDLAFLSHLTKFANLARSGL